MEAIILSTLYSKLCTLCTGLTEHHLGCTLQEMEPHLMELVS